VVLACNGLHGVILIKPVLIDDLIAICMQYMRLQVLPPCASAHQGIACGRAICAEIAEALAIDCEILK
jgi:hypothetical protein